MSSFTVKFSPKEDWFNTQTEAIDDGKYCIYCGKKTDRYTGFTGYSNVDCDYYWHCDCPLAKLEREMQTSIEVIKDCYMPKLKRNEEALNRVKYEKAVASLKHQYNIKD